MRPEEMDDGGAVRGTVELVGAGLEAEGGVACLSDDEDARAAGQDDGLRVGAAAVAAVCSEIDDADRTGRCGAGRA